MSTGVLLSLEQRVSALEQQIAGVQGSEALQPNYLTIDPATGEVSAAFSGFVSALGMNLPTYQIQGAGPAATSTILWKDPSTGHGDAGLLGSRDTSAGPANYMEVLAQAAAISEVSQANLQARDDRLTLQASLNVNQQNRGTSASVNAFAGTQAKTIVRQDGYSDFVDNPTGITGLAITGAASSINFSGSSVSGLTTIVHNFGRVPLAICCTMIAVGSLAFAPLFSVTNVGFNSFQVGGFVTQGPVTGNVSFYCLILG